MKMKEFSFISIGPNPKDEKSMELFSSEDIKTEKEIDYYRNEFYIIYPVIK